MNPQICTPNALSSAKTLTQLDSIQIHWLEVCNFFTQVQCAENDAAVKQLGTELPKVEEHLDLIVSELVKESEAWSHDVSHKNQSQTRAQNSCIAEPASHGGLPEAVPSPITSSRTSERSGRLGSWTSPDTLIRGACTHDKKILLLPPCYFYLFGDFNLSSNQSPSRQESDSDARNKMQLAEAKRESLEANSAPDSLKLSLTDYQSKQFSTTTAPITIGPFFILTLCMYAKHNQPVGARQIILRFLTRLLNEADLPTRFSTQSADSYLTNVPCSILNITPEASIVPLLDMLRQISRDLDPAPRVEHAEVPPRAPYVNKSSASKHHVLGLSNPIPNPNEVVILTAERFELVRFLCALAEKIEQVPDLANFFITAQEATTAEDGGNVLNAAGAAPSPEHVRQITKQGDTLEVLNMLLPYLTHDGVASGGEQRCETTRLALSAVVSLAKCPDSWVQDIVASEMRILNETLSGACHTLITLCKIQGNDDSKTQRCYLSHILRFWSTLVISAPVVASRFCLLESIERDFVQMALVPLLASPDNIVYAAACILTAMLLDELNSCAPAVTEAFGRVILASVVHKTSGRRCEGVSSYYAYWLSTSHPESAKSHDHGSHPQTSAYTSFFNLYILAHLTATPILSEETRTIRDSRRLAFTEWTAIEASLVFIKSLAQNLPVMFLKNVLFLDIESLRNVWKKFSSGSTAPYSERGGRVRGWFATAFAPLIEVNGCFPFALRTVNKHVCGTTSEQLAKEVLERMLRIESNASLSYLHQRQLAENTFLQDFSESLTNSPAQPNDVRKVEQSLSDLPFTVVDASNKTACKAVMEDGQPPPGPMSSQKAQNAWFDEGPHQSPLSLSLSRILLKVFDMPYRVNILLSEVLITICLLPDLRVLYTLMDPERGRLHQSLCMLRDSVDRMLEGQDGIRVALPNTVVRSSAHKNKVRPDQNVSKNKRQKFVHSKVLSTTHPTALELHTLTSLYSVYLEHWDSLPPPTLSDCDDVGTHRAMISPLPASISEEVRTAILESQFFFETCAVLEMLRLELSAVVGYMTLSHSLLNLQPGRLKESHHPAHNNNLTV